MSTGGKAAAIGAFAATIVIGKELVHLAPTVASRTATRASEISAAKIGTGAEHIGAGFSNSTGAHTLSETLPRTGGNASSRIDHDSMATLPNPMHLDRHNQVSLDADTPNIPMHSDTPRAIIPLDNREYRVSDISGFFSTTTRKLTKDLDGLPQPLTESNVRKIVESDLVSTAQAVSRNSDSKISFEILSGKLKVKSSTTIGGVRITGGEVNIYAVAGMITGAVMTCSAVTKVSFKGCVDTAIDLAIKPYVKSTSTENSNSKVQ